MGKTPENEEDEQSKIWTDPRFSHLVTDPRFKSLPKRERKVKIDKRFESMFHDKKFKVKYTVDKYGRKVNKTSSEDLRKYYDIESSDEEDEIEERKLEEKEITKENEGSNDELGNDGEQLPTAIKSKLLESEIDYARGEGRLLSDSSSDDESSEEDEVFIEHVWGELDNDAPRTDESTRRLAACNMDWDRIRASDILVLCNSFLPPGGSILSVKIYPSEFGKERMAEEELHGPTELVEEKENEKDSDSEDDDLVQEQDSDAEEGDEYHMEKLRQYQLNRLKYYYAVIECDSVGTADKLYKECDGLEYESSATKFDLRFIPDDVTFDDDEPKEVCTELPDLTKYKPRIFATSALYQAKVDLTWDETEIERKELNEKIAAGKLHEISDADLRKYVACSSEDEGEDNEQNLNENEKEIAAVGEGKSGKPKDEISMYKSLLEEINRKEEETKKGKFEMEFSWGVNVETKSKEENKEVKKNLTLIEKVLEKKREKNKRRKEERKKKRGNDEDGNSSDDLPDGIDLNDPYFAEEFANGDFEPLKQKNKDKKKSKGNKTDENSEDDEQKAKELELLLDDGDDKQHFSLEKIQKSENETKSKKKRRKKLKKSKQEIEASKVEADDNFEVNIEDNRFNALYTSHLFNIDPTDSHFKKTKGMEKIIQEKLKRRYSKPEKGEKIENSDGESSEKRPKTNLENRLLVKSLKKKIQGSRA